ncbi:hypothetical protein BD410DRAFT_825854 [Rickenella mellea]|uniref:GRF-type domain-containing protein n=1 Tax=Rickenella mellea TaxID=50990 RepID=A0A4Y7QE58_9AGAM|nr:hypothetical protein BD410DRAFT_825854 [Rickenella mellea]
MSQTTTTSQARVHHVGGLGPDGVVRCFHDRQATLLTSHTASNPEREFYCCFLSRDDPNKCKFWKWADEINPQPLPTPQSSPTYPSSSQQAQNLTQRTPETPSNPSHSFVPRTTSARAQLGPAGSQGGPFTVGPQNMPEMSTPSIKHNKRPFGPPQTPRSSKMTDEERKRRHAAIVAALSKNAAIQTDHHSSEEDVEFCDVETNSDVFGPATANRSSDGATSEIDDHLDYQESSGPTPKRYKFNKTAAEALTMSPSSRFSQGHFTADDCSSTRSVSAMLPTPPRMSQRSALFDSDEDMDDTIPLEFNTPTRDKGKGREEKTQWARILDDHDNPYHDVANNLSPILRQNQTATPTSPERTGIKPTESIEQVLVTLGNVSDEFKRLERQGRAKDQSIKSRDRRITDLENQKNRLEEKVTMLEAENNSLKAQRH